MLKKATTKPDPQIMDAIQAEKSGRIWCSVCDTDEYVLLERARRRRRNGSGVWDVDYTCMSCDNFYGHEIEIEDLNATMAFAIITVVQQPGISVRVHP